MGEPNYFGVRHLSPAAAYQLRRALDETRPALVLVERPSDLDDQMQWFRHPDTQYPVAVMAYTKETPVRSILYPFAIYSPEVQAILWAQEHGVACRFMDLPSDVFLAFGEYEHIETDGDASHTTESVYGDLRRFDAEPVVPLLEQLYLRACLTLEDACNCDAKAAGDVTRAMDRLNALQLNHDFLNAAAWTTLLERISDRDDLNTKCSGFAMAMLLERGAVGEELLSREVSRRLSPGVPADLGAGWFEGLAGKNRYIPP